MRMRMLTAAQAEEGLKCVINQIAQLNPKDVLGIQLDSSFNHEPQLEFGIWPTGAECTTTITIRHWQQMAKKKED